VSDLNEVVAQSADAADLHAPVPTLLLELQSLLGTLTATVTTATDRGRRPFRPTPDWSARVGELAYGIYLLADQSGVNVTEAVTATANNLHRQTQQARAVADTEWPFKAE
jgi:hypothetical protein